MDDRPGRLSLPPPLREAAEESVGAATALSRNVPDGEQLAARARSAFTDAFNVTSRVAAALALAAAVVAFSRRSELVAAGRDPEPSTPSLPADLAPEAS